MSAATAVARSVTVEAGRTDLRRLGRWAGGLYVLLVALGMMGPLTLESLLTAGDGPATAADIAGAQALFTVSLVAWVVIVAADLALSVLLYRMFEPGGRTLAALSAGFRIVYTIALAALLPQLFTAHRLLLGAEGPTDAQARSALASLESFSDGFLVALVFFGIHLVLLGLQVWRFPVVPLLFAPLLAAAGIGYVGDSLGTLLVAGYGAPWDAILLTPAVVGEVGLTLWLLVRSARDPRLPG